MSRILLCTAGSLGDIHPFLAVGRELQSRGHEAVIATSEYYRREVESAGLCFHAVRPDRSEHEIRLTEINDGLKAGRDMKNDIREFLLENLRASYRDIMQIAPGCDLIVARKIVPSSSLAAKKLGMPWMSCVLTPLSLPSIYAPPTPPSFCAPRRFKSLRGSPFFQRLIHARIRRVSRDWEAPVLDFQRELEIRKPESVMMGQFSPHGTLALFPSTLAKPQKDWPVSTRICGFCFYDKPGENAALSPEICKFLDGGEAPILFTLGSSIFPDANKFWKESREACRQMRRRGLLMIGNEGNRPSDLAPSDEQVSPFGYAPFSAILPHVAAAVHAGGIGTAGLVLKAGKPALIMPHMCDQPYNAGLVEKLGAARTISMENYRAENIARELNELLTSPGYTRRAEEIAGNIRKENGPATAADEIERILTTTHH